LNKFFVVVVVALGLLFTFLFNHLNNLIPFSQLLTGAITDHGCQLPLVSISGPHGRDLGMGILVILSKTNSPLPRSPVPGVAAGVRTWLGEPFADADPNLCSGFSVTNYEMNWLCQHS
jgi:hypothetical protein